MPGAREMRRKDRELEKAEAERLLSEADYGFLATADKEGNPYVVAVNHVYSDGHIFFHCAAEGHKLDNIKSNPRVCFMVCTEHEVVPETFSTRYKSAIAFGTAEIVQDGSKKLELLQALARRHAPGVRFACDAATVERTAVVMIAVERVTGKRGQV